MSIMCIVREHIYSGGHGMREYIYNLVIVMLIVANVFVCALIINVRRPKCICDECNRARVSGEFYCKEHIHLGSEREICLEVISRSSN